jgi:hypothetical protein
MCMHMQLSAWLLETSPTLLITFLSHLHPTSTLIIYSISINIVYYIEIFVRNKCRCSFYCALFTLHVSAPIGGHLHVVCNTKIRRQLVTVYVNGSVASVKKIILHFVYGLPSCFQNCLLTKTVCTLTGYRLHGLDLRSLLSIGYRRLFPRGGSKAAGS